MPATREEDQVGPHVSDTVKYDIYISSRVVILYKIPYVHTVICTSMYFNNNMYLLRLFATRVLSRRSVYSSE